MVDLKHTVKALAGALMALLLWVGASAGEAPEVLAGRELLKVIREIQGRSQKPAYSERISAPDSSRKLTQVPVEEAAEATVFAAEQSPMTAPAETQPPEQNAIIAATTAETPAQELLTLLPAECLCAVRARNLEYTCGQIDQFIAGASPVPVGISMLLRSQLARLLASPQLNGINMSGDFALFVALSQGQTTVPGPQDLFVGFLVPVTDYIRFTGANPNCSQPDADNVSTITSGQMPPILATPVGSFMLMTIGGSHDRLTAIARTMNAGSKSGLAGRVGPEEAELAADAPVWAYANVQLFGQVFGPLVIGRLQQAKAAMPQMPQQGLPDIAGVMDTYISIFQQLMQELNTVTATLHPQPQLCKLSVSVAAVPGTELAGMLAGAPGPRLENPLLAYLENEAVVNFAGNMDTPFWKALQSKSLDFMDSVFPEMIPAEKITAINKINADMLDAAAGPVAFSMTVAPQGKPPFAGRYIVNVKDPEKYMELLYESTELWNPQKTIDENKWPLEMSFVTHRNTSSYKGYSIDSAEFSIQAGDANSPQAQAINAIYPEGLHYRWTTVEKLYLMTIGAKPDSAIRQVIDQAMADTPAEIADQPQNALAMLPDAKNADFFATFNLVRLLNMVMGFAPVPMPMVSMPTSSNLALAGNVADGRMVVKIALPKQHLMEIVSVFQTMAQQKMQQMPHNNK